MINFKFYLLLNLLIIGQLVLYI